MNDDYGVLTATDTVRIERLLPGPIERLWAYLTEADKRALWLAGGPMGLQPGGQVELVFRNSGLAKDDIAPPEKYRSESGEHRLHGVVTDCEPPTLLAFTWGESSAVRFELTPRGAQVQLVVTHSRLANQGAVLAVSAGWHAHLGILRARLEGQEPVGFWATHARLEAEYARRFAAS